MVRILLAEDDEIVRVTVRDRLEKNHWLVDSVCNGKEAINRLKQEKYRVVISDIQMPELDGWEVLGFLRKSCPGTPILLMTAFDENNTRASYDLQEATEDFILKPFDLDELVGRVNRLLDEQEEK